MAGSEVPPGAQVSYRQQYRRCGKAACSRCASGGPGHGPYWYAYWWEGGRSRSRYLGAQSPAAVGAVGAVATVGAVGAVAGDGGDAGMAPVPAAIAALRVRTLGGFGVWRGDTAIGPEQWASQRAVTLFKCLLSSPGHRLQREQAIEVLWPGGEPAACASNLRTTIHLLRQVLDGPDAATSHLRTEGALLALAPAGEAAPPHDWLDAEIFAQAAAAALAGQEPTACRAALARYGGDYLPDDPYEAWAVQPRHTLRHHYLQLLLHLAALCATHGEQEEAELCLRRVLTAEPSQEDAAATLMGLLAASGHRHEALRVYQALATVLEEELDVTPTADIVALRARILAQEAAPLAVAVPVQRGPPRLTNLPLALTSFVGRTWEVTEITQLLEQTRLVTLTGPGGAGKTRLSLAVADGLVEAYPHGVWLVELAALADPALVTRAVAAALGVVDQPGRQLLDALTDFLRPRRLLLVLDNCEHLIAGCAELATALLRNCPQLRLLATSREGLEVAGEHTYRVPSLAAPDPDHLPALAQLPAYEAVQLFLERARARCPEITLTTENAGAVTQICARLDGLPLAIELAAARVGALPIEAIAARLDDRFRLLTGGPRTALPRQQTLRATLNWSFELLDDPERVLLRRLGVFAGGCTLAAAVAVCAGPGVAVREVMDLLAGLVHKSLLLLEEGGPDGRLGRYRLLETVRQYGWERLTAEAEAPAVRERHLAWCLALAEEAEEGMQGPQQEVWLARLEQEHDNLRAALRWARESREPELGLRMATALWHFWLVRGHWSEAGGWLEVAPEHGEILPAALRAKALSRAGAFVAQMGDHRRAEQLFEEGMALRRDLGDTAGIAQSLNSLGIIVGWRDHERARALLEESLSLGRDLGDTRLQAMSLNSLGTLAQVQGDHARATALLQESLALRRDQGNMWGVANALWRLGQLAHAQGMHGRATELYTESLALRRDLGDAEGTALTLLDLGHLARAQGGQQAATLYGESLALFRSVGDPLDVAYCLEGVAALTEMRGEPERAARLFGAAAALRESLLPPLPATGRAAPLRTVAPASPRVAEDALPAAWAAGRALSRDQAVEEALRYVAPA